MLKKVLFLVIILTLLFCLACQTEKTTTPATGSTTSPATSMTTQTTTSAPSSTAATSVNPWAEILGEPQYGGTLTFQASQLPAIWDQIKPGGHGFWFEHLFQHDWSLDRDLWSYNTTGWTPSEYFIGHLLESWEWPDESTMIGHVRQGVFWTDKPPTNGREFTAYDIEFHYDRVLGTGHGFTDPNPMLAGWAAPMAKVTATDDYTVTFTFKAPTFFMNELTVVDIAAGNMIGCPEYIEQGLDDWQSVCGTGAYLLTDFVTDASMLMSKNTNYWGYDERFPENKLPYADEVKLLNIPDTSTTLAALRTGKVDWISDINLQQSQSLQQSSSEIIQAKKPYAACTVDFRNDLEPFTDIKVRKALQLAIDRTTIAETFYGGAVDGKPCGMMPTAYKGWCVPYDEWPQDLQEEYSFNPDKAKQLLAEAGFPNGLQTNVVTASSSDMELLQIIKAYFLDIGVDMEIRPMDMGAYRNFTHELKHDQMAFGNWAGKTNPPQISLSGFTAGQPTGVNDPAYEAINAEFLKAKSADEAAQLVIQADEYVLRHHWGVVICPTVVYVAWQPYLKGYLGEDFAWAHTREWVFPRLWVDQELKKSMGR